MLQLSPVQGCVGSSGLLLLHINFIIFSFLPPPPHSFSLIYFYLSKVDLPR